MIFDREIYEIKVAKISRLKKGKFLCGAYYVVLWMLQLQFSCGFWESAICDLRLISFVFCALDTTVITLQKKPVCSVLKAAINLSQLRETLCHDSNWIKNLFKCQLATINFLFSHKTMHKGKNCFILLLNFLIVGSFWSLLSGGRYFPVVVIFRLSLFSGCRYFPVVNIWRPCWTFNDCEHLTAVNIWRPCWTFNGCEHLTTMLNI